MTKKPEADTPTEAEFEDFVAKVLQVDPAGLSGKHHHAKSRATKPVKVKPKNANKTPPT